MANNNDDDLLMMMKKKTQPSPSPLTSAESSTWGMKFRAMFCCGGWSYDEEEEDCYDSSRRSIEIVSLFFVCFFSVQNEWYLIYLPKKERTEKFSKRRCSHSGID